MEGIFDSPFARSLPILAKKSLNFSSVSETLRTPGITVVVESLFLLNVIDFDVFEVNVFLFN